MKYWFKNRIIDQEKSGEWFVTPNLNLLFFHDFITNKLKIVGEFPNCVEKNDLFWKEIKYKNIIYFPNRYNGRITRFDADNQKFIDELVVKEIDELISEHKNIFLLGYNTTFYNGKIYFQSRNFPLTVILEFNSNQYRIIYDKEKIKTWWLSSNYIVDNQYVLTPMYECNGITVLDMEKQILYSIYIGKAENRFYSIVVDKEDKYYILEATRGALYELDLVNKQIYFLCDVPGLNCNVHQPFAMYHSNDNIYIVPLFDWVGSSYKTWVYGINTKEIICRDSLRSYKLNYKFLAYEDVGKIGYFFIPCDENVYIPENVKYVEYDYITDIVTEKQHSEFDENTIDRLTKDYQQNVNKRQIHLSMGKDIILENELATFNTFVDCICELDIKDETFAPHKKLLVIKETI